jgi:hypothetical protein
VPAFRLLVCLLLSCVGLGAWAGAAQAEEIFILDNGEALRGHVVRQDDEAVRLRLVGVMGDATVDIPRARIKRRFVSVDPAHRPAREDPTDWMAKARRVELSTGEEDPGPRQPAFTLPEEEPSVGNEGFFQRLARVAVLALPPDHAGRTIIGLLFFAALLVLVLLGGRIAEIDEMGLGRATVLALLLGTVLVVDVWFHAEVLRGDRAVWILPIQGVLWLVVAMGLLRVGLGRTILLFAFVLFAVWVVVFSAGAILVSF